MEETLERLMVAFAGGSSGRGELSWGQAENWAAAVRQDTWFPLGGCLPLDDGRGLDDVVADIRYMMARYEPMRTKLRITPGGRPEQVVHARGELVLTIVDVPAAGDPAAAAERLTERLRTTGMDFTAEWPLRMAVVRRAGEPTHLVALISHLVLDAAGALVMLRETAARAATPVDGLQPLAQAAWQSSPAGRRQRDAALRYWDGHLRTLPARRFTPPAAPVSPRYWTGEFRSPALGAAVPALAARTGVDSSLVLLTLYAMGVTHATGVSPAAFRPMVGNRFRPGLAGVVCTAVQAGLCVVDVAGLDFDAALDRTARASLAASKYAYYDYFAVCDLMDRVTAERGEAVRLGCFVNDRRMGEPATPGDAVPGRATRDATTFVWTSAADARATEELFVHFEDGERITVQLDSHAMAPDDAVAMLRFMESVAIGALVG